MKFICKIALPFFLLSPVILTAETTETVENIIYKSIDQKGNVRYSQEPPQDNEQATSININPPPSEKRIKAAHEMHDRNKEAAAILDENRKTRDKITAEKNRLKRENQKQLQQQQQAEKNNDNDRGGYPYVYPHRYPGRPGYGHKPPASAPIHHPPTAVPHH